MYFLFFCTFVFIFCKVINKMVPDYLLELKPEKQKEGRYMLGTRHEYTPPSWRITKYKKSFLPFAVNLCNNLDEETQSITNYEGFKDAVGANIKENPSFLIGTRQEQVIMAKLRMRCSNLNGHLQSMHIVESSACSRRFVNEDEFHFFFGCPLFNRPRIILQNVISSAAPFTLRTLLYGVDEFDFTENKKIINETLKFIHETKQFERCDV